MPSSLSNNSNKNATKKVRFVEKPKVNLFYKHVAVSENDSLWFSKEEVRRNKMLCEEQGKVWQDKGYGVLLKDVFTNSSRDQLDTFVQLPGADYMRGNENYLSEQLRRERITGRNRAVQAVVDLEITLKLQGNMTREEIAKELATVYQELSAPSQNFAKRLGMADELGHKLGENPELPNFILRNASSFDMSSKLGSPTNLGYCITRFVSGIVTAIGA